MREELHLNNELKDILKDIELCCQNEEFEKADVFFNKALDICNKNGYESAKAVFLCNMALVSADRGKTDEALKLWEDALQVFEKTGEVQNKANLLHNMGTILATRGNILIAKDYWTRSFEIKEKIGDTLGMAATILNLAWVANKENDFKYEKELNRQSLKYLIVNRAWSEIIKLFITLAKSEKENAVNFLSQALWLTIYERSDPYTVFLLVSEIIKNIGLENEFSPVIASGGLVLSGLKDENTQESQKALKEILGACAIVRNIPIEKISSWLTENGINTQENILERLKDVLERIVSPESWVFDRSIFKSIF